MDLIRFFKINDLYRFFLLVVIFFAVKGVLFYFGTFVTVNELRFFVVVKFFSQGKWLYRDVWEMCEPLSSLIYFCFPSSFGYFSKVGFWINGLVLVYSSFYFNSTLQKHDVLADKTFLPAFFFLFLALSSAQLSTSSAPLFASVFLLYVLERTLTYLKKENLKEMYEAGFFLGLASLCYLPSTIFAVAMSLNLLFFTRSAGKAYLLLFLGLLFPWLILTVIYLWNSGVQELFFILLGKYMFIRKNLFLWKEMGYALLPPSLVFLTGFFYSLRERAREINYQNVCRHFMMLWLLGNLLVFFVSPIRSFSDFLFSLPPLSYFFAYYFLQIRKTFVANLMILTAVAGMLAFQISFLQHRIRQEPNRALFITSIEKGSVMKGKRVWVAGSDYEKYLESIPTLKYVNWEISQDDLGHLDHFAGVEHVRRNLEKEKPDWIVDQQNVMFPLFERVPHLKNKYERSDTQVPQYHLK